MFFLFCFVLFNLVWFSFSGQEFDQYCVTRATAGVGILCRDSDILFACFTGAHVLWAKSTSHVLKITPPCGLAGCEFLAQCLQQRASLLQVLDQQREAAESLRAKLVGCVTFFQKKTSHSFFYFRKRQKTHRFCLQSCRHFEKRPIARMAFILKLQTRCAFFFFLTQ